mgnify:CR=1 FL=1
MDHTSLLERILRTDGCVLGLSDAGAHNSQMCDASLPLDFLANWAERYAIRTSGQDLLMAFDRARALQVAGAHVRPHGKRKRLGHSERVPPLERVVQDVEVPIERTAEFVSWFLDNVPIEPIWLCPLRLRSDQPWSLYPLQPGETYVNVGFWGTVHVGPDAPDAPVKAESRREGSVAERRRTPTAHAARQARAAVDEVLELEIPRLAGAVDVIAQRRAALGVLGLVPWLGYSLDVTRAVAFHFMAVGQLFFIYPARLLGPRFEPPAMTRSQRPLASSRAALSMIVRPSARHAAIRTFSVAPTLGKSKPTVAPVKPLGAFASR